MLSRSRKFLLFITVAVFLGTFCSILSVPSFLSKSTTGTAESTEHEAVSTEAHLSSPTTSSSTTRTLPLSATTTTTTTLVLTPTTISPCETFTCSNHGTCIYDEEIQQVKCNCIEPYFGEHCEKHRCDGRICQNGGSCYFDEVLQKAKCSCIDPYIGDYCAINACDGISCQNGGTCIVETELGNATVLIIFSETYVFSIPVIHSARIMEFVQSKIKFRHAIAKFPTVEKFANVLQFTKNKEK
jgi:hypothetical protein